MISEGWRFRGDIEGLRAVAILLVVLFHAGVTGVAGGFVGVDVFFVISGFLIVGQLLDELRNSGTISLSRFWARRARRLLPAATLVSVSALLLSLAVTGPADQLSRARTAAAFSAYGSNWLFAHRAADYFRDTAPDPLLHTWSLAVEEQYYLFFAPLLLFIAWLAQARRPKRDGTGLVLKVLMGLTGLSLVAFVARWRIDSISAFYLSPYRVWEFGAGALLATAAARGSIAWGRRGHFLAWASMAVVVAAAVVLTSRTRHLSTFILLPVVATALIISTGGANNGTSLSRLLDTAPMRWLGRVSYSWYLWHWPLLILLADAVDTPSIGLRLAVVAAALVPATASLYLIEAPIRSSRWLAARPRRSLAMAAALALITVLVSAAVGTRAARDLASRDYAFLNEAVVLPGIVTDGCHADRATIAPRDCTIGPVGADTTIALFGDSHAAQWYPALERLVSQRGWRLASFTKTSCPATWTAVNDVDLGRPYSECEQWRSAVLEELARRRPLLTIISNYHGYDVELQGAPRSLGTPEGLAYWQSGLRDMLRNVVASSGHVMVLQDPPIPLNDPMRCIRKYFRSVGQCFVQVDESVDEAAYRVERTAASDLVQVKYVSLNSLICRSDPCAAVTEGIAIYRDRNHLSAPFARSLAPALNRAISDALRSTALP